jgi:hypothetical protein
MTEESDKVLKKAILGVSLKPNHLIFCTVYVTDKRLIFKDQKGKIQKIGYTHIHEFVTDQGRLGVRFIYPRPLFGSAEEFIRMNILNLERIEGGGVKAVQNTKWAAAWKKYISNIHEKYLHDLVAQREDDEDELLFVEQIERSDKGLDTCENVKSREKMLVTCPNGFSNKLKVYITNRRILIKLKSSDYIIIPYSLIYEVVPEKKDALLHITFSYPQQIEGVDSEISEVILQRIPVEGEEYPQVHNTRWVEEWEEFFAETLSLFAPKKGVIDLNEMAGILSEMRHSPAKYNLTPSAQKGWDTACASAIKQLKQIGERDLYQYLKYLIDEYENWQVRAFAEPDEARRKAYDGSVQALSSILTYVAKETMLEE